MLGLTKKFLISTSVVAGMSAVVGAPAMAAGFTASGTAGADYLLYKQQGANTVLDNSADLNTILQGNSSAPGGNIELGVLDHNFNNVTTLSGEVGGKNLTLSNLTAADWTEDLKTEWFDGLWGQVEAKKTSFVNAFYSFGGSKGQMYSIFDSIGGFERSSDPNISYINTNGSNIDIGLAGHYNMDDKYGDTIENALVDGILSGMTFTGNTLQKAAQKAATQNLLKAQVNGVLDGIQASEVVKYEYGSESGFLYSFFATDSGLVEIGDGLSHTGNYEVSIAGVISPEEPESVPEPSTMLGLVAVGGLFAASKRNSQKKA
jgi:hypothetical protein